MELTIYEKFQNLIPPQQSFEYQQLEENILRDGCTTPLNVWRRNGVLTIVDGHHRYKICKKHDIPFKIREIDFDSDDDATIWIIRNQFGRRNLSNFHRAELALVLEPLIATRAKANCSAGGGDKKSEIAKSGFEKSQNPIERVHTDETLAQMAGVSSNTIRRAKVIKEHGTSEQIERARSGKASVNAIYTEIKHRDIKEKTCPMCGETLPIDRFYGEGATCKTCTETRKQILLSGGSVSYKVDIESPSQSVKKSTNPDGYSQKMREENKIISSVVSDLYNTEKQIVHTVDHLLEDLESLTKDFIGKVNRSLEIFSDTLTEDGARQKVYDAISAFEEDVSAIRSRVL